MMLAVLGLFETIELYQPTLKNRKYWVDSNHCLCVEANENVTTQYYSMSKLLEYGYVEAILDEEKDSKVEEYVD